MAERPRLTLPAREPGARRIVVDGVQAGHVLASHAGNWTAHLWAVRGDPRMGLAGEVKGADLRDVHGRLAERLAEKGPWWS